MQCLLQQCADIIAVALVAFLVQLDKEVGCGLEGLVDGAGVLAVQRQFFQSLDEPVKELDGLVVYIIDRYADILFLYHNLIFIREDNGGFPFLGCCIDNLGMLGARMSLQQPCRFTVVFLLRQKSYECFNVNDRTEWGVGALFKREGVVRFGRCRIKAEEAPQDCEGRGGRLVQEELLR